MNHENNQKEPSCEQINALRKWAEKHGRNWKSALREAWMTGNYGLFDDAGYLQQIRNQFGPIWLVKFRLSQAEPGNETNPEDNNSPRF